ncbi:phage tail protein [Hymenobacter daeguensis]
MRLRATTAGLVPIMRQQAPAEPTRRNWLMRLGAVVTGAAVAAPALAAPRKVQGYQPYVGEIMLFAGNFAPQGWAFCDGSLQSIADYSTLFQLIGTTYGGDGQTTFGLPDLRGRAPRHQHLGPGLSNYVLGQVGGAETRTLTTAQMPAHNHAVQAGTSPTSSSPVGTVPATLAGVDVNGETVSVLGYAPLPTATVTAHASTIQATGGGQPFDAMPPSLVMNYCISLYGIFPTQ